MRHAYNTTERVVTPRAPGATVLVRVAIAFVFMTEGIQRFLYPEVFGVGLFTKLGAPSPDIVAPVVAGLEIACGALILFGLLTRVAAFVLAVDMIAAILVTKVPILLGHGFWGFPDPATQTGFWTMAHDARSEIAMLLACGFLVAVGAGPVSLDHRVASRTP